MALCEVVRQLSQQPVPVISEPDALTCLLFTTPAEAGLARHSVLRAVVQLLVHGAIEASRAAGQSSPTLVGIKPRGHCIKYLPELAAACPELKNLFLYRDCRKTVGSMVRAFGSEPIDLWRRALSQSPMLRWLCPQQAATLKYIQILSDDEELDWAREDGYFFQLDASGRYTLLWASICRMYTNYRNEGLGISAVRYEDLLADPEAAAAAIAQYIGVDPPPAGAATQALSGDAHAAGVLSSTGLSRRSAPQQDTTSEEMCKTICERMGIPRDGTRLVGTLNMGR